MNRRIVITLLKCVVVLHLFIAIPADFILAMNSERGEFTLCHFSPLASGCYNYWIAFLWLDAIPLVIMASTIVLYLLRSRGDSV